MVARKLKPDDRIARELKPKDEDMESPILELMELIRDIDNIKDFEKAVDQIFIRLG